MPQSAFQARGYTADNASPNDVMIQELAKSIDTFLGKAMHVRCFDHSLNLMAKVRVGDPGNFCVLIS